MPFLTCRRRFRPLPPPPLPPRPLPLPLPRRPAAPPLRGCSSCSCSSSSPGGPSSAAGRGCESTAGCCCVAAAAAASTLAAGPLSSRCRLAVLCTLTAANPGSTELAAPGCDSFCCCSCCSGGCSCREEWPCEAATVGSLPSVLLDSGRLSGGTCTRRAIAPKLEHACMGSKTAFPRPGQGITRAALGLSSSGIWTARRMASVPPAPATMRPCLPAPAAAALAAAWAARGPLTLAQPAAAATSAGLALQMRAPDWRRGRMPSLAGLTAESRRRCPRRYA